ncbi:MAG: polysaccharide biosynthesis C-terminal domain-containing protein [Clostridia bacterium]|nr:polysaccharide biosynthesis C-terminal domain-containing protein [Clostridia bacterium]
MKQFLGDRIFYRNVLKISLPIMIQSGFTNAVSMLDNVMVGSIGTEAMSGVSIVNQLLFVFSMVIFGAGAAIGIFTSQYHGAGDVQGVRYTFRLKICTGFVITIITVLCLVLFDREAISLFLHETDSTADIEKTLIYGRQYLKIMLVGLLPYALSQAYASTLRESAEVKIPLYSGIFAIICNVMLNFLLIFGLFGFPALGVVGAAIATVVSRFAELFIVAYFVHKRRRLYEFILGAYSSFKIPRSLLLDILKKGFPLLFNELLWSLAITVRNQCISTAGLDAVAAFNIQTTVTNVLNITYIALGSSIAIIVGNALGAGELDRAKNENKKLLTFSALVGLGMGLLQISLSEIFPLLYNVSSVTRELATYMLIISGISLPANALAVSSYYTLRSGGLTLLTMLFDCVYAWVITVPVAVILSYLTDAGIHLLFAGVIFIESAKCILGIILIAKVKWARKLT